LVSSTCVSTEDAVKAQSFHTNNAKPHALAYAAALGQPANTHQSDMLVCAAEQDKVKQDQQIGILRRKPGRGARSLSMSCSDKLASWGLLGVQVPCQHTCNLAYLYTLCDDCSVCQTVCCCVHLDGGLGADKLNMLLPTATAGGAYLLYAFCLHCHMPLLIGSINASQFITRTLLSFCK